MNVAMVWKLEFESWPLACTTYHAGVKEESQQSPMFSQSWNARYLPVDFLLALLRRSVDP